MQFILNKSLFTFLLLVFLPWQVYANTIVFIPGYLSNGHVWRTNGVTRALVTDGWIDGGNITASPAGPRVDLPLHPSQKRFYTVELPNEARLTVQATYLKLYIDAVRARHPKGALTLVGHSAGGVVARYMMVTQPSIKATTLITIASPHLGSEAAEIGKLVSSTPASLFAPMLGLNTINRSSGLYQDLARPNGRNLLSWLNSRQHPKAAYISIIHSNDDLIDPRSQDMNLVPALSRQGTTLVANDGHELNPSDGVLLRNLLRQKPSTQ